MAELSPIDFLTRAVQMTRNAHYGTMAATTMLYLDWLLLLDKEVEFIHKGRWTLIRVTYTLTRYYPLLIWPVMFYSTMFDHDAATCRTLMRPMYILHFPFQCLAQFVMVYRAYVFTGYKTTIKIFLGTCYLALVVIELWAFLTPPAEVPDSYYDLTGGAGCFADYSHPLMQVRIALMMSAAVVMDLISLVVVLFRVRRMMLGRNTITSLFIQEGLLSFGGVVVVNGATAIVYFSNNPHNGSGLTFMFLMSNIFACRTILHLRNVGKQRSQASSVSTNPVVLAAMARTDENSGRLTKNNFLVDPER